MGHPCVNENSWSELRGSLVRSRLSHLGMDSEGESTTSSPPASRPFAVAFLGHSVGNTGEPECNFHVTHLPTGLSWWAQRRLADWVQLEEQMAEEQRNPPELSRERSYGSNAWPDGVHECKQSATSSVKGVSNAAPERTIGSKFLVGPRSTPTASDHGGAATRLDFFGGRRRRSDPSEVVRWQRQFEQLQAKLAELLRAEEFWDSAVLQRFLGVRPPDVPSMVRIARLSPDTSTRSSEDGGLTADADAAAGDAGHDGLAKAVLEARPADASKADEVRRGGAPLALTTHFGAYVLQVHEMHGRGLTEELQPVATYTQPVMSITQIPIFGLRPGVTYEFDVRAMNAVGASEGVRIRVLVPPLSLLEEIASEKPPPQPMSTAASTTVENSAKHGQRTERPLEEIASRLREQPPPPHPVPTAPSASMESSAEAGQRTERAVEEIASRLWEQPPPPQPVPTAPSASVESSAEAGQRTERAVEDSSSCLCPEAADDCEEAAVCATSVVEQAERPAHAVATSPESADALDEALGVVLDGQLGAVHGELLHRDEQSTEPKGVQSPRESISSFQSLDDGDFAKDLHNPSAPSDASDMRSKAPAALPETLTSVDVPVVPPAVKRAMPATNPSAVPATATKAMSATAAATPSSEAMNALASEEAPLPTPADAASNARGTADLRALCEDVSEAAATAEESSEVPMADVRMTQKPESHAVVQQATMGDRAVAAEIEAACTSMSTRRETPKLGSAVDPCKAIAGKPVSETERQTIGVAESPKQAEVSTGSNTKKLARATEVTAGQDASAAQAVVPTDMSARAEQCRASGVAGNARTQTTSGSADQVAATDAAGALSAVADKGKNGGAQDMATARDHALSAGSLVATVASKDVDAPKRDDAEASPTIQRASAKGTTDPAEPKASAVSTAASESATGVRPTPRLARPGHVLVAGFEVKIAALPDGVQGDIARLEDLIMKAQTTLAQGSRLSLQAGLRLIMGSNLDLAVAEKKLEAVLRWRQANSMDKAREQYIAALELPANGRAASDELPVPLPHADEVSKLITINPCCLVSAEGNPVSVFHIGSINAGVVSKINQAKLKTWSAHCFEYIDVWVSEESEKTGKLVGHVQVFDLQGMSMWNATNSALIDALKQAFSAGEFYVEMVSHIYVINSSSVFSMVWRLIKQLITPRTTSKITVANDVPKELLDSLAPRSSERLKAILKAKKPTTPVLRPVTHRAR